MIRCTLFNNADYGIIGDAFEIIPEIIQCLEKIKNDKIKLEILGLSSSVDTQTGYFTCLKRKRGKDGSL